MKHFLIINVVLVSLYVRYTLVAADLRTETKIVYSKLLTKSDRYEFIFEVMHVTLLDFRPLRVDLFTWLDLILKLRQNINIFVTQSLEYVRLSIDNPCFTHSVVSMSS